MHPNPIFRSDDQARALVVARARGFGALTVAGPDGILASHIPIVVETTAIAAHLVRSNPMARLLRGGPAEALLIVSGPDGYISPDWYWLADQVPTWNYVAIHIRGTLRLLDDDALVPHLERLSEINEARLAPKKPWTMDKNRPETLEKLLRMIVPVELAISSIDSTFKLNQNKPQAARNSAAQGLEASPIGQQQRDLAALMRDWHEE